ncbi:UNKNOWN [Stylonychia lemnae]|uniref:Uncharacterized protein n=1 Tax=Stylonychia lemnae TaxID=5949 RepID=A0A078B2B8_STYLE|nr:UNKNOWN [Stylonychia lemnae]|eukprot:CDW87372.1 UNKNOWN [Stylonychia lemnae]
MTSLYDSLRRKLNMEESRVVDSSYILVSDRNSKQGLDEKYLSPSVNDIDGSAYSQHQSIKEFSVNLNYQQPSKVSSRANFFKVFKIDENSRDFKTNLSKPASNVSIRVPYSSSNKYLHYQFRQAITEKEQLFIRNRMTQIQKDSCECGTQTVGLSCQVSKRVLEIVVDDRDKCILHKNEEIRFIDADSNDLLCIYCALQLKQTNPFSNIISTNEKLQDVSYDLEVNRRGLDDEAGTLKRLKEESEKLKDIQIQSINQNFDKYIRIINNLRAKAIEEIKQVFSENDFVIDNYSKLLRDHDSELKEMMSQIQDLQILGDQSQKFTQILKILTNQDIMQKSKRFSNEISNIKLVRGVFTRNSNKINELLAEIENSFNIIKTPLSLDELQQSSHNQSNLTMTNIYDSTVKLNEHMNMSSNINIFKTNPLYINNKIYSTTDAVSTVTTQRRRQQSKNKDYLTRLEVLSEDLKSYNQYSDSNLLSENENQTPTINSNNDQDNQQVLTKEDEQLHEYLARQEKEYDLTMKNLDKKFDSQDQFNTSLNLNKETSNKFETYRDQSCGTQNISYNRKMTNHSAMLQ